MEDTPLATWRLEISIRDQVLSYLPAQHELLCYQTNTKRVITLGEFPEIYADGDIPRGDINNITGQLLKYHDNLFTLSAESGYLYTPEYMSDEELKETHLYSVFKKTHRIGRLNNQSFNVTVYDIVIPTTNIAYTRIHVVDPLYQSFYTFSDFQELRKKMDADEMCKWLYRAVRGVEITPLDTLSAFNNSKQIIKRYIDML